jgi:hypothetical protein
MTLATYADLIAELPFWVENRPSLVARYPVFVALCEAKMNRMLRVRRMIARTTITASAETLALPSDFVAAKTLRLTGGSKWQLEAVTEDGFTDLMSGDPSAGEPQAFGVEGGNFVFWPPPSSSADIYLVYYQAIPGLQANSSNWMLSNHPDAYLYGAVAEAWSYVGNADETSKFATLFMGVLGQIGDASVSESQSDRLTPGGRFTVV